MYVKGQRENTWGVCLFVCLFGVYLPTREFFTHMETSPLPVKACKFWPLLGTHGNWAVTCHTYCDMGLPFIMVIPRTRDTHTCCRAFGSGAVTTCFLRLRSVATGDRTPISSMRVKRSTSTPQPMISRVFSKIFQIDFSYDSFYVSKKQTKHLNNIQINLKKNKSCSKSVKISIYGSKFTDQ